MRSTRREALGAMGVAAAAMSLVGLKARTASASVPAAGCDVRRLDVTASDPSLGDLQGRTFGSCVVTRVGAVEHGSVPVSFQDGSGRRFTVDVLRHDDATPGVARGASLAVYVKTGTAQQETNEEHGLAAMSLAAALAEREAAGSPVPQLLTLRQRARVRSEWNRRELLRRGA